MEGHLCSQDILLPPVRTSKKARQPSISNFEVKIGPPNLTRFEKARIIGARSLQIAMGAPPFVPLEGGRFRGPIDIATAELEEGALPISIRRALPNGITQDIPINALTK
jgi:DNA-directed RNA polymerase I, II, and III subunit RPABC2